MSITRSNSTVTLGLAANWRQFSLLVVVNAFVGAMVGLERAIVPLMAAGEFGVATAHAMLSFIATFGIAKAATNLLAGRGSEFLGRKPLLVAGWIAGLPVPVMLLLAPDWSWVVGANVLLGINQGLCWSTTVIMKVDLVGPERRGFALGLNESAGYLAVAVAASLAAFAAGALGFRTALFVLGMSIGVVGLVLAVVFVRETKAFAEAERLTHGSAQRPALPFSRVFAETTIRNRNLSACTQAGLVNNLNDGMSWGLLPLLFASRVADVETVGLLVALYPAVWGVSQIGTGAIADRVGRKTPIVVGMFVQAAAIWLIMAGASAEAATPIWITGSVLLGLGTALVYPALLAAVSDAAAPSWRATAVGVYRLWRDLGYVAGALVSGIVVNLFGIEAALAVVALLTAASGCVVAVRMRDDRKVPAFEAAATDRHAVGAGHDREPWIPPVIRD